MQSAMLLLNAAVRHGSRNSVSTGAGRNPLELGTGLSTCWCCVLGAGGHTTHHDARSAPSRCSCGRRRRAMAVRREQTRGEEGLIESHQLLHLAQLLAHVDAAIEPGPDRLAVRAQAREDAVVMQTVARVDVVLIHRVASLISAVNFCQGRYKGPPFNLLSNRGAYDARGPGLSR